MDDGPCYTESTMIPLGYKGAIFAATSKSSTTQLANPGGVVYFKHVPLGPEYGSQLSSAMPSHGPHIHMAFHIRDEYSDVVEPASKRTMDDDDDVGVKRKRSGNAKQPYPENYQTSAQIVNFDGTGGVALVAASPTVHSFVGWGSVKNSVISICTLGARTCTDIYDDPCVADFTQREHYILMHQTTRVGDGMPDGNLVSAVRLTAFDPITHPANIAGSHSHSVDGMWSIVSACVTSDMGVTHVRAIIASGMQPAGGGVDKLFMVSVSLDFAVTYMLVDAKVGLSSGLNLFPTSDKYRICLQTIDRYARGEDIRKASFQWAADSVTWVRPLDTGVGYYIVPYDAILRDKIVAKYKGGGKVGNDLLNAAKSDWALCCLCINDISQIIVVAAGDKTRTSEMSFKKGLNSDWSEMHGFTAQRNQVISGPMEHIGQPSVYSQYGIGVMASVIMGREYDGICLTAAVIVAEYDPGESRYKVERRANLLYGPVGSAIGDELGECNIYHSAVGETYLYSTARKTVYVLNV